MFLTFDIEDEKMVWVKNIGMKPAYVCDSCGSCYRDPKLALECENLCKIGKPSEEIRKKALGAT